MSYRFRAYLEGIRRRCLPAKAGFTLIETLVAISLLSVAIVAPMALTSQSLASAYYARDQITAFNLAQDGLEAVRAHRDGQILQIAKSLTVGTNLFGSIPVNQDFTVDTRLTNPAASMQTCSGTCSPLQTDGDLYGYDPDTSVWIPTNFTRVMHACYVQSSGACNATVSDEIRLTSTVIWTTGFRQVRTFVIHENLYRWVNDGAAATSV